MRQPSQGSQIESRPMERRRPTIFNDDHSNRRPQKARPHRRCDPVKVRCNSENAIDLVTAELLLQPTPASTSRNEQAWASRFGDEHPAVDLGQQIASFES
jgi:hypothetical protein